MDRTIEMHLQHHSRYEMPIPHSCPVLFALHHPFKAIFVKQGNYDIAVAPLCLGVGTSWLGNICDCPSALQGRVTSNNQGKTLYITCPRGQYNEVQDQPV